MESDPLHTAAALSGPALHDAKRAMRVRIITARDAFPPAAKAAGSDAITARIRALPSFAAARCVLLTLPFRSEWDSRPLFALALASGKTVALPRVDGASRMLELHAITDIVRDTAPGYRGISEPHVDLPRVAVGVIDWVLVPGVAFDLRGRRLGYGGGFYDRLLALLDPGAQRVAGAFDLQVAEHVPAAPHDLVVDAIVTETRMIPIARAT